MQKYSWTVNRKQVGRNEIIQHSAHESFYSRILPSTSRHFSQNQGLCPWDLLLQTASCTRLHKTHGRLPFPQSALMMIFTQFCVSVCVCVSMFCVCLMVLHAPFSAMPITNLCEPQVQNTAAAGSARRVYLLTAGNKNLLFVTRNDHRARREICFARLKRTKVCNLRKMHGCDSQLNTKRSLSGSSLA